MTIIWTIIIGFIIGLVARFLMPGRDPAGFLVTTLLGVVGAVVGHWVGVAMGMYRPEDPAGFFMSVFCAMGLLFLYRLVSHGSAGGPTRV